MNEYLSVGQIINTHGLKGEVKIYPLTDDVNRFKKLKKVIIDGCEKEIIICKIISKFAILKIEGIDSIEEAMKYKGKYIEINRKDAVNLSDGQYFACDIVGCTVRDENDREIGKISEVIYTGSNDVYNVEGEKQILIPAIKSIINKIDINEGIVIIKPLEEWYED